MAGVELGSMSEETDQDLGLMSEADHSHERLPRAARLRAALRCRTADIRVRLQLTGNMPPLT